MVLDRFFFWVTEATAEQRIAAVGPLARAFFVESLDESDRETIEAALTLVAEDDDVAVRRAVAEALAGEVGAPRHILLELLWDEPEVAAIVAARSQALIDAELVEVVARGEPRLACAIAHRRRVGADVAVALAEAGDLASVMVLLNNPGADIPAVVLERVVERFGDNAELREVLMSRPHVPITVRHRVLEKLAEAIGNLVVLETAMSPERAELVERDAKDRATIALAGSASGAEAVVLVEHLRMTGQLTTRLLLRAACVGDLRFLEEAFASLAGLPVARVAALVADGRESAFLGLYRRAGLPERAYPAFHAAIEVHRDLLGETGGLDGGPGDRARFSRRLVERVLTRYTSFDRRDSDDLLLLLRRFAADAARERVQAIMAERRAEASRLLPAPAVLAAAMVDPETIEPEAPEPAPVPALAAPVAAAVAPTPIADDPVAASAVMARPTMVVVAADEMPAPEAVQAVIHEPADAAGHDGEAAEWIGLFSHVRPEDLPPEWVGDPAGAAFEPTSEVTAIDPDIFDEMETALGEELASALNRAA